MNWSPAKKVILVLVFMVIVVAAVFGKTLNQKGALLKFRKSNTNVEQIIATPEIKNSNVTSIKLWDKTMGIGLLDSNDAYDPNRYNIIFVGYNFSNAKADELRNKALDLLNVDGEGVIYPEPYFRKKAFGLFGTEPFKSNITKFNAWYVYDTHNFDDINAENFLESSRTWNNLWEDMRQAAPPNSIFVHLSYDPEHGIATSMIMLTLRDLMEGGGRFVFLHEIAHKFDINHLDRNLYPSSVLSYEIAKKLWGDLIGAGCGAESIIDCAPGIDIYSDEYINYITEIGYFADQKSLCFSGKTILENCAVVLNEMFVNGDHWDNMEIAFFAMRKEDCQNSEKNCYYRSSLGASSKIDLSSYHFFDRFHDKEFECNSNNDRTDFDETYGISYSCATGDMLNFMPQINREMTAQKYNMVYVRHICEQMRETLGSVGGICNNFPAPSPQALLELNQPIRIGPVEIHNDAIEDVIREISHP